MTQVEQWVQNIVEDVCGRTPFSVGAVVEHPSGRTVKITKGEFWGEYGVSNFWYWQELNEDGSLGPEEHGYGW